MPPSIRDAVFDPLHLQVGQIRKFWIKFCAQGTVCRSEMVCRCIT